jgi:hypothetical protein
MFAFMKRLSPAVRQLAERHARLNSKAQRLEEKVATLAAELVRVNAELAAAVLLWVRFDSRVNPDAIEPIAGWKGKYGKRGALRGAILELLKAGRTAVDVGEPLWRVPQAPLARNLSARGPRADL